MDFDAGFVDTDGSEISVPAPVKAAMAGKFMSPEEAARLLGISVDDVNRLVDRKQLFPMRDGATNKFKTDDVERLLRTLGEESGSGSGSGELDLDLPEIVLDNAPAGGPGEAIDDDQLILDDGAESIFSTPSTSGSSTSDTGVGIGSVASNSNSGLSLSSPGLSGADLVLADSVLGDDLESDDLAIESIVGASSPSLGGSGISQASGSGDLMIELSGISSASSAASKSDSGIAGLSGPGLSGPGLSGPGLGGLSGGLGSGVSLGDSSLADSGVDLGSAASAAKGAFSADDFELGGEATDDESASVVIASDSEAGDSSFFGQTIGGQSSSFGGDDSSLGSAGSAEVLAFPTQMLDEMSFSAWQIVGLVCCSLLLLFGGFIAYDLVRTIGSPESTTLSNPLLNSLAEIFGWR